MKKEPVALSIAKRRKYRDNKKKDRALSASDGRRGCVTCVFGVGLSRKEGGGRGAKRGNERWKR